MQSKRCSRTVVISLHLLFHIGFFPSILYLLGTKTHIPVLLHTIALPHFSLHWGIVLTTCNLSKATLSISLSPSFSATAWLPNRMKAFELLHHWKSLHRHAHTMDHHVWFVVLSCTLHLTEQRVTTTNTSRIKRIQQNSSIFFKQIPLNTFRCRVHRMNR